MSTPVASAPTICAIGNFDGVHRGHLAVLAGAASEALDSGIEPIALTFDPPPAVVLGRNPPALLTGIDRKIELIHAAAPSVRVVVKRFDRELAGYSPERFAEEVLVSELRAVRVLVGQNFRFGKGRAGDLTTLATLGKTLGFTAQATELIGDERGPWSSTRARESIAGGDFADILTVLGRPHALTGTVIRGDQRGRTIGFPTANLGDVKEMLPPFGVYAVLVDRLDRPFGVARALGRGVANIGVRPTVGAGPAVEVHVLEFLPGSDAERDLYGAVLRIHLLSFLRPEKKFEGLDALRAQIERDSDRARDVLVPHEPALGPLGGWY